MPKTGSAETEFNLQVIATDIYGNSSKTEDVRFKVVYGHSRAGKTEAVVKAQPKSSPVPASASLTPLQNLAMEIASHVDSQRTLTFYDQYRTASTIPGTCGSNSSDADFLSTYRKSFEHVMSRLDSSNIWAFYKGVCDVWNQMLAKQKQEQSTVDKERKAALDQNKSLARDHDLKNLANWGLQKIGLMILGGGFSAILLLSLGLANLANENHAKVMRELATATRALEETISAKAAPVPVTEEEDDRESNA